MRILVVDDDETLRLSVRATLELEGYEVDEAVNGAEAVELVQAKDPYQAVFLDVNMPIMDGLTALKKIRALCPQTLCMMLTAFADIKDAVQAIKVGAFDYLEKPVESEQLLSVLAAAREANELVEKMVLSAPQVHFAEGRQIVGGSTEIKKVFDVIGKLAQVETSVLIRGESGTGKELVARAIHYNSDRKRGPFVAVNCAAIPENLIESELFGHEKGAFTGADRKKIGKFQYAAGGTLFLDEIGDISQATQVKLLRVLQEKSFIPVGANVEQAADVRIISATHRPLEKMIQDNSFRSDLFYRLNVLPIHLPPLRDRREDILPLCEFLMRKFNKVHNRKIQKIDKKALNSLRVYGWPGNIRELENVIEHAFILESSDVIHFEALPELIRSESVSDSGKGTGGSADASEIPSDGLFSGATTLNYPQMKEQFEKEFLIRALKAFDGRVNQTAEHTRMTKVTLLRKLEKYGIDPKQFHRR